MHYVLIFLVVGFANVGWSGEKERLRVTISSNPQNLDPRYGADAYSEHIHELLFDTIVTFDETINWQPSLAERVTYLNETTLEIVLRKGVMFSDGTPLTAADVKATYEYIANPKTQPPSPKRAALNLLKSIVVRDDYTLRFHLTSANAAFISDALLIGIVPKRFAKLPVDRFQQEMIGSGPYRLKTRSQKVITLSRNPYYNRGTPKIPVIEITINESDNSRYLQVLKGDTDITDAIPYQRIKTLQRQRPKLQIIRNKGLNTHYLLLNHKDPLIHTLAFRKALAYALNRDELIQYKLGGFATPADGLLPPFFTYYTPAILKYDHNTAKAIALLKDAGLTTKLKKTPITLKVKASHEAVGIAQLIANQLKAVGIQLKVESLEWGTLTRDRNSGNFQMIYLAWVGYKDPDLYRFVFHSDMVPPAGANRGHYKNAQIDQLTTQGQMTLDVKARRKVYKEIMRIERAELPYIYLWHKDNIFVAQGNIHGFQPYPNGSFRSFARVVKE